MRIFLSVLVLIFSLQSWTKADDIRNFTIEGMSIGDSLLDHFSEEFIETRTDYGDGYKSKEFFDIEISNHAKFETYDGVQISVKSNDKKFIIHGIDGIKIYKDINQCLKVRKDIVEELSLLFSNADKYDRKKISHPSYANSFTTDTFLTLSNENEVVISCYDFSEDVNFNDQLRVSMWTKELNAWLIR